MNTREVSSWLALLTAGLALALPTPAAAAEADLILHHGKVITVDKQFSIQAALAIRGERILRLGSDEEVLRTRGPHTEVIDLAGKVVLPGLIDSHAHPADACMTEFDHPIPPMESIDDVLAYIRSRAAVLARGEWIELHQVFITRLREQRYPTRAELDAAAPHHPVLFATGPDASLNSLALKLSGIGKDFRVTDGGPGYAEKDPATGEPTGILRSCTRYVKNQPAGRQPEESDRVERLLELFKDYHAAGLTAIIDRDAAPAVVERYRKLHDAGRLTLRIAVSAHVETIGEMEQIQKRIRRIAQDPLTRPSDRLRIVGIKTYLDGGMLTGSAYMREPWGTSRIYAIKDPNYRGVLFIPRERLLPIVQTTAEAGLQFTAHSVGDGAVHTLLDVYEELDRTIALRKTRPCLTHANFVGRDDIARAARLGVMLDVQPVWLYLDTRTLTAQFGYDRLRWFQPLRSLFEAGVVVGGGSDHMQKIGARRAVNSYDPFLGMATAVTRRARWYDGRLHPEEALSRERAVRLYTSNNARFLFLEDQIGSLAEGKLADLIVVDTDILTCPEDCIEKTRVLRNYVGGKLVYLRK
jgi:predicted amidohydrolase YtcJ